MSKSTQKIKKAFTIVQNRESSFLIVIVSDWSHIVQSHILSYMEAHLSIFYIPKLSPMFDTRLCNAQCSHLPQCSPEQAASTHLNHNNASHRWSSLLAAFEQL